MKFPFLYLLIIFVWSLLTFVIPLLAIFLLGLPRENIIINLIVHAIPIGLFALTLYLLYLFATIYVKKKIRELGGI